jgi:Tol biopolymer transport system component
MPQWNSLVGHTLGQYQIVELIGEGGMAAVYKAWQPSLRRYVALKVLTLFLADDAEFVKRFHQEAVAAANLKQTNIVTIHDVGVEGDYHYIAMELIEGTSLAERVRSGPVLAPEQVVDIISQIGAALDYAHERGFIHRDVKPANILIDASGRVVLTDFGLVKALSGSGVTSTLTRAGTVFGTPRYMSPEQVKDEPLDYRSDLYALGIVCYEMLSGQVPFDGTTTHSILYAQANTPPPPLRDVAGLAVPPPVEAVVEKMLAKEREKRYQSAGEFARDLAQAVIGVWPARLGKETAAVKPEEGMMEMVPGAQLAPKPPTMAQPGPQRMSASPPPKGRDRSCLMWGLIGGGIVLVLLALGLAAVGVMFWPRLSPGDKEEVPPPPVEAPVAPPGAPVPDMEAPAVPAVEQIAFTSERDGNAEIYVMNSDGSGQTNLTNSPSADFYPQWSPDRSRIAFHSYESGDIGGNAEIYVMAADGSDWIRLTRNVASDKFPNWSPDGGRLVFVSDRDGDFEIYAVRSDGSQARRLTSEPARDYFPAWSPSGDRILFESDRDGDVEIYVMGADGGNPINLTQNSAADSLASWSPDGTKIAFTSDRSGQPEVWVMDSDGNHPIRLTSTGGRQPDWSPDGTRIVFVSERDGNAEIYVMNSDGSAQVRLTRSVTSDWDPHWSR